MSSSADDLREFCSLSLLTDGEDCDILTLETVSSGREVLELTLPPVFVLFPFLFCGAYFQYTSARSRHDFQSPEVLIFCSDSVIIALDTLLAFEPLKVDLFFHSVVYHFFVSH